MKNINEIGVWTLRIILAIGAIVSGCMGFSDVAGGCVVGLVASFVFALNYE